jgi:hypothetical protein
MGKSILAVIISGAISTLVYLVIYISVKKEHHLNKALITYNIDEIRPA